MENGFKSFKANFLDTDDKELLFIFQTSPSF